MNEFMLIFRRDHETKENQPSPEEMQASIKRWQDWKGSLAAQNKLVSQGNRLHAEGRVITTDKVVINGPYAEIKEAIGGFIVIRARDFEEAAELAKDCPVLRAPWKGNVEVRMLVSENNS
jgi:hypothetical protein